MRRVLVRLAIFGLIQLGIAMAIFPTAFSQPRPGYLAALEDKIHRLREFEGQPRVIFVGGSSVAFGIQSQIFEQQLQQPAVNLGLHASLGLDFYLRLIQQHGRAGDVVVLLPEYAMLLGHQQMSPEDLQRTLRSCPAAIPYLQGNLRSSKTFVDNMALSELAYWAQKGSIKRKNYVKSKFRRWMRGGNVAARRRRPRRRRASDSIYRRASFNQHGDMIAHHGKARHASLKGEEPIRYDQVEVDRVIERLNQFASLCREGKIRVFFSYPPMPDTQFRESAATIGKLDAALRTSLAEDIAIVDSPEDSVFPESQFFDTVTHLSQSGQALHSRRLARELVPEIVAGRTSPTDSLR